MGQARQFASAGLPVTGDLIAEPGPPPAAPTLPAAHPPPPSSSLHRRRPAISAHAAKVRAYQDAAVVTEARAKQAESQAR